MAGAPLTFLNGLVMMVTMPETRKKPCSICRSWFRPDPRVGGRQRACRKPDCQAVRRKKTQAAWRARNPDYFMARRIQARGALARRPEPLRLAAPLAQLPWDLAQDQFGVQGADFIGVLGTLLLRAAQDQCQADVVDSTAVPGALLSPAVQDQRGLAAQ
jgi:hypothetical protein